MSQIEVQKNLYKGFKVLLLPDKVASIGCVLFWFGFTIIFRQKNYFVLKKYNFSCPQNHYQTKLFVFFSKIVLARVSGLGQPDWDTNKAVNKKPKKTKQITTIRVSKDAK